MDGSIRQAAVELRAARRVVVLTGAGLSSESGIPTFRDALTGLWSKYDPAELATPEAFARNPELVSRWYDDRRCQVARCRPNPGHVALSQLQRAMLAKNLSCTLVTQNVDRLHQAAGAMNVIELHGTLWVWRCLNCHQRGEEPGPAFESYPPRCRCGGLRRPDVVWFGEMLPEDAITAAQEAVTWCDYFISVGTSSVVYPAAGLIEQALTAGAKTLEVNPQPTPFSEHATWSIRGKSGEVLPKIIGDSVNGVPCDQ
jgi:NAD-dependent deacetylase